VKIGIHPSNVEIIKIRIDSDRTALLKRKQNKGQNLSAAATMATMD
jgi:hypothetical protein